eukprot:CAMPEP_0198114800 /NCGR_PEP_ID=MMETSP1442-20131203/6075_1 /TAXON_ID= /ORGANISM="Craspedostauros australis, Strain CCMP3328" /LENGTH=492 /DNA_ID=CAMNT_0043772191 /DNA_START=254 /DNA_END=1731 /DNA_ORIENTATION=+
MTTNMETDPESGSADRDVTKQPEPEYVMMSKQGTPPPPSTAGTPGDGMGRTNLAERAVWKVPASQFRTTTFALEFSGRPDNLPDQIDAFLWGKLAYHVTSAFKAHNAPADSLNRWLLGIAGFLILSIFIAGFLGQVFKGVALIIVLVLNLTFLILIIVRFFRQWEAMRTKHECLNAVVEQELVQPFRDAGYSIKCIQHKVDSSFHESSFVIRSISSQASPAPPEPPATDAHLPMTLFETESPPIHVGGYAPWGMASIHEVPCHEPSNADDKEDDTKRTSMLGFTEEQSEIIWGAIRATYMKRTLEHYESKLFLYNSLHLMFIVIFICARFVAPLFGWEDKSDVTFVILAGFAVLYKLYEACVEKPRSLVAIQETTNDTVNGMMMDDAGAKWNTTSRRTLVYGVTPIPSGLFQRKILAASVEHGACGLGHLSHGRNGKIVEEEVSAASAFTKVNMEAEVRVLISMCRAWYEYEYEWLPPDERTTSTVLCFPAV